MKKLLSILFLVSVSCPALASYIPVTQGSGGGPLVYLGTSATLPNIMASPTDTQTGMFTAGAGKIDFSVTGVNAVEIGSGYLNLVQPLSTYNINGSPVLRSANNSQPSLAVGVGAGASLNWTSSIYDAYFGFNAGNAFVGTAGEDVGVGSFALLLNATGGHDVCVGSRDCGGMTADSQLSVLGGDADRNSVGQSGLTAIGASAGRNGGTTIATNNTFVGFSAGYGNAGSVCLGGTATPGDVIHLVFTFNGAAPYTLPGSPVTVSYTVLGGDTLATITTALEGLINANASLNAATPVQVNINSPDLQNLNCMALDFAGTALTGAMIVASYTQGGNTESMTITGGSTGGDNIAIGDNAMPLKEASTAQTNIAIGKFSLEEVTTATNNIAIGFQSLQNATTPTFNVAVGGASGQSLTTGAHNTLLGYEAGNALITASNNVHIGYLAAPLSTASSNVVIGAVTGSALTSGSSLTIVGSGAGIAGTSGNFNTYVGTNAGAASTGGGNVAIGANALQSGSGGSANETVVGQTAGKLVTGNGNTIIGNAVASTTLTTGASNILIGVAIGTTAGGADTPTSSTSHFLNIGNVLEGDMTNATAVASPVLYLTDVASSVDYLNVTAAATGNPATVAIAAAGTDTNVSIALTPKGTGGVGIGTSTPQGQFAIGNAAAHAGQATCWTTGGAIGYCTTVVGAGGACTCTGL